MLTNPVGQWSKANYFQTLSDVHNHTVCSEHLPTERAELYTCSNLIPHSISADEHVIAETHHPPVHEKHSCLHPKHQMESYDEKLQSHNGDKKRKLSLEIWLPNTRLDNDDEGHTHRTTTTTATTTSEVKSVEKNPELIPSNENRPMKSSVTTLQPSVKSKPIVSSHIDQNKDYSIHTLKRHPTTLSTDYNQETNTFKITEVQTSAKNVAVNTESKVTTKTTKSKPISLFLQKYSSMKKDNHALMTNNFKQIRLPDLKSKASAYIPRTSSTNRQVNPNIKLLARCPTSIRSSYTNLLPQLRVFSLTNQPHSSPIVSSTIFLTTLSNKKTNETSHPLQRSRTLLDISSTTKIPSHMSSQSYNSFHYTPNKTFDKIPCLISKRMSFTLRSKQ